jgi:predicted HicB family RNase H-like nuclease
MQEFPGTSEVTRQQEGNIQTPQSPHVPHSQGGQQIAEPPAHAATATAVVAPPQPDLRVDRRQEVFRVAGELFRQAPDWVVFFREILGLDGIVRRMFSTSEELASFEKTAEYGEIQHMIAKLREQTSVQTDEKEPTRVITVRLPKSLHESLRTEAHERRTSMNKLCISKLLQVIDDEMVPSE